MSEEQRTRVLVTGATGRLGRALLPRLVSAGFRVRAGSRSGRDASGGVEWARMDLTTGGGVDVTGVDVVVHLAAAPYRGRYTRRVEVDGTQHLIGAAAQAGVRHLIYLSIVGVDRVPWGYFRIKAEAERLVAAGGLPWSILRATQFYEFVDQGLRNAARLPLLLVLDPQIVAQPVDVRDMADLIRDRIETGPSGETEEVGGPEVLDAEDALRCWLETRGLRRRVLRIRLPGKLGSAFRGGGLVGNARPTGGITWAGYLGEQSRTTGEARGR